MYLEWHFLLLWILDFQTAYKTYSFSKLGFPTSQPFQFLIINFFGDKINL